MARNLQVYIIANSEVAISGTVSSSTYSGNWQYSSGYSNLAASFNLPDGMDFVPPQTYINKQVLDVQQRGLPDLSFMPGITEQKIKNSNEAVVKMKRMTYEQSKSPVQFKSYLTFVLGNNGGVEFSVQHSFYGYEFLQTGKEPETFPLYGGGGDQLYIKLAQ